MKPLTIGHHIEEIITQIVSARKALKNAAMDFDYTHYFLVHCAIIYNFINPNTKPIIEKNGNESDFNKKCRNKAEERREKMKEYFGDSFNTLTKKNYSKIFRNHLEHIDTRFDDAVMAGCVVDKNLKLTTGPGVLSFNNLAKESQLRGFDAGVFTFHDQSLNIAEIEEWLNHIDIYIKEKGIPTKCSSITNNIVC